jgi:3-hydroxybutyryl-CoA dehydrogenase
VLTDGRTAQRLAHDLGTADVAVFDRAGAADRARHGAGLCRRAGAHAAWQTQAGAWLAALGFTPLPLADAPGLVVARTIAMLINEAPTPCCRACATPPAPMRR